MRPTIIKRIVKKIKDNSDPQFTFTSGGGPGIGIKLKHLPIVADMDITGPGGGITIPLSVTGRALKLIPNKRVRDIGDAMKNTPGNIYMGFEAAGILPVPFVGLSVGLSDKNKLLKLIKRIKNGKTKKSN